MTVACPHCGQTLDFSGHRPNFCAFCGKPLDPSGLRTTEPDSRDAPTIAHTPLPRASRTPLPSSHEPPHKVGGYRIIRPLGQGGMGTVYEAEESGFGRKVALKLLAPEITASPEALQRFRQEGRLASAIAHPRCVFVLNADEQDGRPFITMELMPGTNLNDLVLEKGSLPIDEAVVKIHDVIEGLSEAHRLGVIHRDVKPSNCFLEAGGRVKIGDFGLSKSLVNESNLTRTGSFLGTPLYASPEQIKGESLDPRTDVYSVAATLYFLLTGRPPFQGTDAAATLAKIVSDPIPSLRSIRSEIPAELDRIILKALDRNRERRWRDMAEFGDALLPFSPGRLQMGGVGMRIAAFVLDVNASKFVLIFTPTVAEYVLSGGRVVRSMGDNLALSAGLDAVIFTISFLVLEPLLGSSPAKWLLGLRVRGQGTSGSSVRAVFLRNLVFGLFAALPWQGLALGLSTFGRIDQFGWMVFPLRVLGIVTICSTMRISNGYRGLHDLASGTRVVGIPRIRRRRPAGARRALGRDRNVAARPVGVLKTVGPYRIRGAVRWEEGRRVLAAEDSTLGREVWVVLRPKASPALDAARRDLSRATRPRWLTGGEQAEGRWDAYIAPSGSPIADLAGPEGLPWRDVRPIFEDLLDELDTACRDGTLPDGLTLDQVWIQPDGRAMIVDQLGLSAESSSSGATLPGDEQRALDFLYGATCLALEGGRRRHPSRREVIHAALPEHARKLLDSLFDRKSGPIDFRRIREEVLQSRDLPLEVSRGMRATQLGAMAAVTLLGLGLQFHFVSRVLNGSLETHGLLMPSSRTLPLTQEQTRVVGYISVLALALLWISLAILFRGSLTMKVLGLCLRCQDGRPAARWRCALRATVIWLVPGLLLAGAIALQGNAQRASWPSWALFGTAAAIVALYPVLAMVNPSRSVLDRLAGTVIVPR